MNSLLEMLELLKEVVDFFGGRLVLGLSSFGGRVLHAIYNNLFLLDEGGLL